MGTLCEVSAAAVFHCLSLTTPLTFLDLPLPFLDRSLLVLDPFTAFRLPSLDLSAAFRCCTTRALAAAGSGATR